MSDKTRIDQGTKRGAMACRLGLAVLPIWLALAAVTVPTAAAPRPCRALVYQGQCVGWKARPFAFSPDGRYLYFEYQYVRRNGLDLTHKMIGRYDLRRKAVRIVRSACDTHYKSGALSPDGRYLAMHAQGMGRYGKYPFVRDESLEILDLKTGRVERVQDRRFKAYRNVVFAPGGRRVYFTQHAPGGGTVERVAVYDRRTLEITNLYPRILESNRRRHSESIRSKMLVPKKWYWSHRREGGIWVVQYMNLERRTGRLTFVGRTVRKPHTSLLRPLAEQYGVDVDRLRHFRLVYSLEPRTRSLTLHPANKAIIEALYTPEQIAASKAKRLRLFRIGRGVHSFVPMPSGRSYLVFHRWGKEYTQNTKLRVLRGKTVSNVVAMPWFASAFIMSRDESRVAYNFWHQKRLGRITSIAVRDVKTGRSLVINPGEMAHTLLEPVAERCRKNKSR